MSWRRGRWPAIRAICPSRLSIQFDNDGAHASLCGAPAWNPDHRRSPKHGAGRNRALAGQRCGAHPAAPDDAAGREIRGPAQRAVGGCAGRGDVLPLTTGADAAPRGVLILAANPYRRREDDSFENFAALVARQIASTAGQCRDLRGRARARQVGRQPGAGDRASPPHRTASEPAAG